MNLTPSVYSKLSTLWDVIRCFPKYVWSSRLFINMMLYMLILLMIHFNPLNASRGFIASTITEGSLLIKTNIQPVPRRRNNGGHKSNCTVNRRSLLMRYTRAESYFCFLRLICSSYQVASPIIIFVCEFDTYYRVLFKTITLISFFNLPLSIPNIDIEKKYWYYLVLDNILSLSMLSTFEISNEQLQRRNESAI